jgi:hypothetical protein
MSNIFVIAYDVPRPNLGATQLLNYWHRAEGTPQTIDTWSGNPHFVGRFTPHVFNRIQTLPSNQGIPQVIETTVEPSFIARFQPPVYQRIQYQPDIQGTPQVIDTVGANPHFVGKFTAPTFNRIAYNSQVDTPVIIIGEAQPHFIGRFTSPTFQRAINSWDTNGSPFVLDTVGANPHFIGTFTSPSFQRIPYFSQADSPPTVETNTHFIGRFTAPTFQRAINSWDVQGQPFVVDTVGANPHFIGTYTAPTFQRLRLTNDNADLPVTVVLDNPQNFITRFQSPSFSRIGYSNYEVEGTSQVFATEIPVNFLATFQPTKFYNSVSYLSFDTGTAFVPPPPVVQAFAGRQITPEEALRSWMSAIGAKGRKSRYG